MFFCEFCEVSRNTFFTEHLKTTACKQKQLSRGVLKKKCSENMKQIYRRTSMPKCDFKKIALHQSETCLSTKFILHWSIFRNNKMYEMLTLKGKLDKLRICCKHIRFWTTNERNRKSKVYHDSHPTTTSASNGGTKYEILLVKTFSLKQKTSQILPDTSRKQQILSL